MAVMREIREKIEATVPTGAGAVALALGRDPPVRGHRREQKARFYPAFPTPNADVAQITPPAFLPLPTPPDTNSPRVPVRRQPAAQPPSSSRTFARPGTPVSPRTTTPWPLVALFTAGISPLLLPTTVGRLDAALPLTTTEAGAVGSALLLGSATAGFTLAAQVERFGPRRLARLGPAARRRAVRRRRGHHAVPAVVAGTVLGGFGSGTAAAVAAAGIAAQRDPHRVSTLGLLTVSASAGALYLTIPRLGGGHALPFAALALTAPLALSRDRRSRGRR